MNTRYRDILERIDAEPVWWDEHAVPRYCEFSPNQNANIYADEVVLLLVQCQECGKPYKVCVSSDFMERYRQAVFLLARPSVGDLSHVTQEFMDELKLSHSVAKRSISYGDPPNGCPASCAAGATMSSVPVRVLEFWRKGTTKVWDGEKHVVSRDPVRDPELEVDVWPEWMPEEHRVTIEAIADRIISEHGETLRMLGDE